MFQNHHWDLFKLFDTALISAYLYSHTEIVKLLLAQTGINVNAKGVYLFHSLSISII